MQASLISRATVPLCSWVDTFPMSLARKKFTSKLQIEIDNLTYITGMLLNAPPSVAADSINDMMGGVWCLLGGGTGWYSVPATTPASVFSVRIYLTACAAPWCRSYPRWPCEPQKRRWRWGWPVAYLFRYNWHSLLLIMDFMASSADVEFGKVAREYM